MITKNAVIDYIMSIQKEYKTEEVLIEVEKDLKRVDKILAMLTYNRLEGYKEISLVTVPTTHLNYKIYKR